MVGSSAKECNMKNEQIFREKDKVFHYKYGWGKVVSPHDEECYTRFEYEDVVTSKLIPAAELSFTEYDFVDGGLSHERPFVLEVGKSYVSDSGFSMVIDLRGERDNYGFWHGNWVDDLIVYAPDAPKTWREATDKEVKSALLVEVNKRYGLYPESKRIVEGVHYDPDFWNPEGFSIENIKGEGWRVSNQYGCLFYKGKWAEPLEEDLRPDFKVGELILVRNFYNHMWSASFFESYGDDHINTIGGGAYYQFMRFDENYHGTSKSPEQ